MASPALAQCPAGTGPASFEWSTSPGSGNEWSTADDTDGDARVYTVTYVDAYGNPNSVDITVTLQDPDAMNFDDNFVCPGAPSCDDVAAGFQTETNGAYGAGFLTVGMASTSASQSVGFDFTFSKPVTLSNFEVSDIDDVGFNFQPTIEPWDSFQDEVSFSASNGGTNVPVTLVGGSNMTIVGQTATAIVVPGVNGNLAPGDAAGTVTASTTQPFDTFSFSYANGPDDATNEGGAGASNGHAVRLPGFDTLCVEDTPPALAIDKTSNPSDVVAAGDPITYTIVVTNPGPGAANDVVLTDVLPNGVAYVPGSAQKTYWVGGVATATFSRDLGSATFDTPGLTQSFDTTGSIPAGATLTSYGFTTTGSTADWLSDLTLSATYPGGTAYTLGAGSFGGNGPGAWNVSRGPGVFGGAAEGTYSFVWGDGFDGVFGDDNAISTAVFTIEYEYDSGRTQTTDAAGAPPNLVTAADGVRIEPGESMTVTFDVTVDDPLDLSILEITNVAEATATGITTPVTDDATNPTEFGVPVTLARFQATELGGSPGERSVRFEWMTATEVGNLGFNLFVVDGGRVERINDELIASPVIDSVQPQVYSFEAHGIHGRRFVLVDVDTRGGKRFHGPFRLDEPAGSDVSRTQRTDWKKIRAAHRAARDEREGRRRGLSGMRRSARARAAGGFPAATVHVDTNGVQRVSYEDLIAAGIDLSGAPLRSLALTQADRPVPIRVRGRGAFGPGAYVEFLGEALDTLYTRTNVYRLEVDRAKARRVPVDPTTVSPATPVAAFYVESKVVEEDHLYSFAAPGDDPWYDRSMLATSGPVSMERDLELDDWIAGAAPVELTLELWGGTDFPVAPDHHVVAEVNGFEIADELFDGLEAQSITVVVDDSMLEPSGNTIELVLPHRHRGPVRPRPLRPLPSRLSARLPRPRRRTDVRRRR